MAWLREQGYTVDKVEQRVTRKILRDFMGFADILAVKKGEPGVVAAQATTAAHAKERMAKILAEPRARLWVECGQSVILLGWREVKWGEHRKRWEPDVYHIFLSAFDAADRAILSA
jgi:hypothetical protein